jgi:predicted RNA-binding Zn-ribbon protein involved in translation (DUF1610 family)
MCNLGSRLSITSSLCYAVGMTHMEYTSLVLRISQKMATIAEKMEVEIYESSMPFLCPHCGTRITAFSGVRVLHDILNCPKTKTH